MTGPARDVAHALADLLDAHPAFAAAVDSARRDAPTAPRLHEPLLRAQDVADLLGVPKATVLRYARDGRLPSIALGKHVRFDRRAVERALGALAD